MAAILPLTDGWEHSAKPPLLFRRYQFASYRDTRTFLDELAALSEETGLYPDLGFGTTYVNVTVRCESGGPTDAEVEFANRSAALPRATKTPVG